MADFCAAADVYCGRDHLEQRIDPAGQPGDVLDLSSAAALGRTVWADVTIVGLERRNPGGASRGTESAPGAC